jgi:hypothetical protein
LEADDKEELATAAAAVESLDLLRGQVAFLDGDEHVGHGAVVSWANGQSCRSLEGCSLYVLNHKLAHESAVQPRTNTEILPAPASKLAGGPVRSAQDDSHEIQDGSH